MIAILKLIGVPVEKLEPLQQYLETKECRDEKLTIRDGATEHSLRWAELLRSSLDGKKYNVQIRLVLIHNWYDHHQGWQVALPPSQVIKMIYQIVGASPEDKAE